MPTVKCHQLSPTDQPSTQAPRTNGYMPRTVLVLVLDQEKITFWITRVMPRSSLSGSQLRSARVGRADVYDGGASEMWDHSSSHSPSPTEPKSPIEHLVLSEGPQVPETQRDCSPHSQGPVVQQSRLDAACKHGHPDSPAGKEL